MKNKTQMLFIVCLLSFWMPTIKAMEDLADILIKVKIEKESEVDNLPSKEKEYPEEIFSEKVKEKFDERYLPLIAPIVDEYLIRRNNCLLYTMYYGFGSCMATLDQFQRNEYQESNTQQNKPEKKDS